MSTMTRLGAGVAATLTLLAPALWNGFALLQYDTGGYLARWYEGTLVPSRAVVYGLMLAAGAPWNFWPVAVVQAALTVWILALMLHTHGLGRRPLLLFGIASFLALATTLPWLTSILLTDIFAGLTVLALYLLVMRAETLHRAEIAGLIVLVAVGAATHSATVAVLLSLILAAALAVLVDRRLVPLAGLGRGLLALALGVALVLAANFAVARRLAWTPGGFALVFGRMLQDGIVKRYLDDHCPDPLLRLCAHHNELPDDADVWFWGSDLFDRLGRFAGLGKEMETIVIKSIAAYPWLQLKIAAIATARQLVFVRTGEGVETTILHTYAIMERYTPSVVPAMRAAHQQRGEIGFAAINRLHVPVALASILLLLAVIAVAYRRHADIGVLAATVLLAILANAVICGVLAKPHDRYGARIVWLATLVMALAPLRMRVAGKSGLYRPPMISASTSPT
ncbi:MAG: hypothetical protein GEU91_01225 [Rhizobiales bacterium]|nr:hypothetical protein [Hyphomicrobiales bacterium]